MFTFALLLVLPALILADPPANLEEDLFKALDTNKNGKVEKDEAEGYFLAYDTNKNGIITEQEFTTNVDKVDTAFVGHEAALFALLDENKDGKVDKTDLDAAFKRVDEDNDNIIERSEFKKAFATVVSHVG